MSATTDRWDSFLGRLRERVEETLAQAEEGCAALLDVNGLDTQPLSVAWMAIEGQLHELRQKVEDTWSEKVEPALEEEACPTLDAERAKGDDFSAWLERRKDEVERRIFSGAARRIYEQARLSLAKDRQCAQCGAPLALDRAFFRSRHLTCPHCSNVNTFVPGSTITAVEHFCCHHLAREKTAALWTAWLAAEQRQDEDRPAARAALEAYTVAYLRARIDIVPEYQQDFEKDLKGKLAFFDERFGG